MDSDLGFLLIFIILPTALIVSGFWFLALMRKDARIRDLSQASTLPNAASELIVESLPGAEPEPAEPLIIATLPDSTTPELEVGAIPPVDVEDEPFWSERPDTQTLLDPAAVTNTNVDRDVPEAPSFEPEAVSGYTEEIASIDGEPGQECESDTAVEQGQAPVDDEPTKSRLTTDQTRPSDIPVGKRRDEEAESSTDQPERRRRQPDARLVPSSENVKKRTNAGVRRAPPIARSTGRDEDTVESPDSGRDV